MIKPKQKPCKGTGKAKGHGCGKPNINRKNGLCHKCWAQWYFSTEQGMKRVLAKAKKEVEKKTKKEDKEKKINLKSIRGLIIEAKVPFQKLIRIRDHRKQCICCTKQLPFDLGAYDAGHYFKSELYSGLIFHPDNVNGQTKYCNKYLNGNESGYSEGLKKRIGIERYEHLVELSVKFKDYKWDRSKLIELKKEYKSFLFYVEKGIIDISEVDFSIGIVE